MAMSKSLRNPVILEAILEQFSTDSMDKEHLNLRLTSKLFNEICLRRIRKTHRHLKMRYCIGGDEDTKEEDSHALKINQHVVFLSKSKQYFRFLKDVAKVRVQHLTTDSLNLAGDEACQDELHRNILNLLENQTPTTFIGMYGICPNGCEGCERLAIGAKAYGPLQNNMLGKKCHFEELQVYQTTIMEIASDASNCSSSREQCLSNVKSRLSNISCDLINFRFTEKLEPSETLGGRTDLPSHPFPREILDEMIAMWQVKRLRLEIREHSLHWDENEFEESGVYFQWLQNNYFTKIRFDDPFWDITKKTQIFLEHVELDFDRSFRVVREIFYVAPGPDRSYRNVVENMRRVFPSRHLTVACHMSGGKLDRQYLESLLHLVFKDENVRNSRTTIRYFPLLEEDVIDSDVLPMTFSFRGRHLKNAELQGIHPTCRRLWPWTYWQEDDSDEYDFFATTFQITDSLANCVVDLEIYLPEGHFEVESEEEYDDEEEEEEEEDL